LESEFSVAREVIEKLIDDIDGGNADETVQFGLDGTSYEIDLSKKNAAALRKALVPYLAGGRRSSPGRTATRGRAASPAGVGKRTRDYDIVQLREWAGANDIAIPSRGRIPQTVLDQYKAAGGR
jgi:hypothetical protein